MKRGFRSSTVGLVRSAAFGVFLALVTVLVAACGDEPTPAPLPTLAATAIPAPDPTPDPTPTPRPAATAKSTPEPTSAPTAIPTIEPTPQPTPDPMDAIKAEVAASVRQFGQALSAGDGDALASLFLQSSKTNSFSSSEPLRVNGWLAVESSLKGLVNLPAGSASLVSRQGRVEMLSDEAALWTGHFILNVRPPEEPRQTIEGRMTAVLQNVDGKWLRVHMHTSALPQ